MEEENFSVLRKANTLDIKTKPFPHIVIKNALPQELADSLELSFPITCFDQTQNNQRKSISFSDAKKNENISREWKEFLEFHGSKVFLSEFIELFKGHLIANQELRRLASKSEPIVGRRNEETLGKSDVLMEAQISINTPVKTKGSVVGIHVDNSNKLFAGLLYLRKPEDDSVGGNLNLYSWKEKYSERKKLKLYYESLGSKGSESLKKHVSLEKEIEYGSNVLVLFPNSIDALHAVTPRGETVHPRVFVNCLGVLPFNVYQRPFLNNKIRQIKKSPNIW